MKKSTAGIIAGAAGILLLAGGSTYALWSDSGTVNGGSITTGNLDVEVGAGVWQDVSDPNAITGVTLADFTMVPGDTLQLTQPVTITATGDNIRGRLSVTSTANTAALFSATEGVTATYRLMDGTTPVTAESASSGVFGTDTIYDFPAATAKSYTVQITVSFDETTPDQVKTTMTAALSALTFTLDQVRPPLAPSPTLP